MGFRLLTIIFSLKMVLFLGWLMATSGLFDYSPVHAEEGLARSEPKVERRGPDSHGIVTKEEKGLLEAIRRREKELDRREEALANLEQRLTTIRKGIDERMLELKKLRAELDKALSRIDEANSRRTQRIVKIYESMPPEDAAARLEKLDEKMAVMILSTMKEKKAGKILSMVAVEKSVRFSQLMSKPLR